MVVIRVAAGTFPPEQYDTVAQLIADGETRLREPIEALEGLIRWYSAVDREHGAVTNASLWTTLEAAHQMDALQAMLDERPALQRAGVTFEPARNHEVLWDITP
jgi:hypothetical protein